MRIVLLGAPGSGKGTQAAVVAQRLGIDHIASGDLFREAANRGDELGQEVKAYMEKGLLVPDEVVIKMILERLSASDSARGFILDGFPRTLEQAEALDRSLEQSEGKIEKAVYIKVSTEELVKRLGGRLICRNCQTPYHEISSPPKVAGRCDLCGDELYRRPDDAPQTVRKRLEVYFAETAPLIAYYREAGKLVEINGERGIEEVGEELIAALTKEGGGDF
ncbi:MAG: adenylate kinase [Dehalococcoidia bacterium]|nr:adenylate kinase [Chloroflexota bacterium]MCK4242362.1 adenylate kinase [Dehalococcoidia bacterium]